MRWSETLIPTLKQTPSEAEIVSHQLLLRAGLVRKLTGGLYIFLPLGLRALRKVESIVRQEMDRAGAVEVLMPALQPPEIWEKSGRYETAEAVFFKARDHAEREWILGPTHEEVITSLVAHEISSYRQLPKNFYQIQTKFRDEIRPRFGLMRAKEFIMKDAYSFDATDEASEASYRRMYDAYVAIFRRCGLNALAVEADTGVMGGKFSHEFMVPADTGESEVAYTETGDYAANLEKATSRLPESASSGEDNKEGSPEKFPTPGVATIEALSQPPYNIPAEQQIKTMVYLVESRPVLVLLRGDFQVNEAKLGGVFGTSIFRQAGAEEIAELLGAHPGSLGAVGVKKIPVYADEMLRGARDMTTGANEDGYHYAHVSVERDIEVSQWEDVRTIRPGDPAPTSGEPLKIRRAIEVGHVFKLGTKYSERLGATFLDAQGKEQPAVMGCYGIGVTRVLQAIIEQSHDEAGIVWPVGVAPYQVCVTPLKVDPQGEVMQLAERIHHELQENGVDTLLDDRDERPGVKFKDSELVGFPLRVAIGDKGLAKGEVELKVRGGELESVPREHATEAILKALRGLEGES